jgi:hypothetical protein
MTRPIDIILWSDKGMTGVWSFSLNFCVGFPSKSIKKNSYLPVPCKIVKTCNTKHNIHSSVKGKKNEVTPLNTRTIWLVLVVSSTAEAANRDLNALGSDTRGAIAILPSDGWNILVNDTNLKCSGTRRTTLSSQ